MERSAWNVFASIVLALLTTGSALAQASPSKHTVIRAGKILDVKSGKIFTDQAIVIDGRNLYKPEKMQGQGFTYVSVGRPASYSAQQGKPKGMVS